MAEFAVAGPTLVNNTSISVRTWKLTILLLSCGIGVPHGVPLGVLLGLRRL